MGASVFASPSLTNWQKRATKKSPAKAGDFHKIVFYDAEGSVLGAGDNVPF